MQSIPLALRCAQECLNDVWYMPHIPSPGACYTQIRVPLAGFLPSSSPGWTQVLCRAHLWLWLASPALPLVQVEGHSLPDPSLPYMSSSLCWTAPEPCKLSSVCDIHTWSRFQGNFRIFMFCRSMEISQRSSRGVHWQKMRNLSEVTGYCLKGSQASRETVH